MVLWLMRFWIDFVLYFSVSIFVYVYNLRVLGGAFG